MNRVDLSWRPDEHSAIPLFRQLTAYLRDQILAGALAPGTRLPPQRILAQRLEVNRSTIVAAYQELQADGLVAGHAGGGTVVCPADVHGTGNEYFDWHDIMDREPFVHDRSLAAEVAEARTRPGIVSLAQGELAPELRPTATLRALFHEAPVTEDWLGYEDMYGYRPLRESIAEYMTGRGAPTDPGQVLALEGAQQGLYLICRCLLQPGDTVVVEAPSYLLTLGVLQMAGIRILRAPLDQHGLAPDRLEELLARRRAAMIFTTPAYQNPTAAVLTSARRATLLALCERYHVPLVEDDVYGELGFDGAIPAPLYALDRSGYVIYVSSLSKNVAPGLRVGWIVAPPHVTQRLAEMKYHIHYGSCTAPQWVAQQWLARGHHRAHLTAVTRALQARRDVLEEELRARFGSMLTWRQPRGGFHLWAHVHAPVTSTALFRAALHAGVGIKPGSLYGVSPQQAWLRLSFQHASLDDLRVAPGLLRAVVDEVIQDGQSVESHPSDTSAL